MAHRPHLGRAPACAPACAALLSAACACLSGCLVEFPDYVPATDAANVVADGGPIPTESFDWTFELYGVVVDPAGGLKALTATARTEDGQVVYANAQLDGIPAVPEVSAEPVPVGEGAFEMRFPEMGELLRPSLTIRRAPEVDLGMATLRDGETPWPGIILAVRHQTLGPVDEGPPPKFRFASLGTSADALPAGTWAVGSLERTAFSIDAGRDLAGAPLVATSLASVTTFPWGGFSTSFEPWHLRGAFADSGRVAIALQWSAFAEGGRPLPWLWLGVADAVAPTGAALTGSWALQGVVFERGRWRGDARTLEIGEIADAGPMGTAETHFGFTLRDVAGNLLAQGDIDTLNGEVAGPNHILKLDADDLATGGSWRCMASGSPRYLVAWPAERSPTGASLYFGLRQR